MKECNACGVTKPLTEFYKRDASNDGCQGCCKECSRGKSLLVVLRKRERKAAANAHRITEKLTGSV